MPVFGPDPRTMMPTSVGMPQPTGMFGNRFDNPLAALAMIAGPAMMAHGFNMPQLANLGPQVLSLQAQSRQAAEERSRRERELRLKESAAARDTALRERIARMFGASGTPSTADPVAALEAARAAGGAPGPTTAAAGMMAPAGAPGSSGGMFPGMTGQDRQLAALMAQSGDPMAALRFAAERTAPAEPKETGLMTNLAAAGLAPGSPAYEQAMLAAVTRPQSTVNVGAPQQETAEAKEIGKYYAKQFTDLQDAGSAARRQNNRLDALGTLLDRTYTGAGGESVLAAKRLAQAIGFNPEGIGEAEAAQAIANEFALQLRNPAGGAGMPGAMSDRDREFLQSMSPGLGMTPEGRKLMIEVRKRQNQRDIEVSKMARNYRKKHGSLDEGFMDEVEDRFADSDMYGDLIVPETQMATPGPAAPTAATTGFTGFSMPGDVATFEPSGSSYEEIQTFLGSPAAEGLTDEQLNAIGARLRELGK